VRETYEDPVVSGVLHVRRLAALGYQLHADDWSAWVTHVWGELVELEQERRERERERG